MILGIILTMAVATKFIWLGWELFASKKQIAANLDVDASGFGIADQPTVEVQKAALFGTPGFQTT